MSKEVDIKDLATEIAAGLTEYDQNVADEIKTIVDDVAQAVKWSTVYSSV